MCSNRSLASLFLQFQQAGQDQAVKSQCSGVWGRQVKAGCLPQQQQSHNHHHHQQIRNGGRNTGYGRAVNLPHAGAWRSQQVPHSQHSDTAMRAVLLGGSGVKRERAGTGVFLPCRHGNPPESRKKSGILQTVSMLVSLLSYWCI